jgi:hypothetical protein
MSFEEIVGDDFKAVKEAQSATAPSLQTIP